MPAPNFSNILQPMLPGLKPVLELLEQDSRKVSKVYCRPDIHAVSRICNLCHKKNVPVEKVDNAFLDSLCARMDDGRRVAHQGVIALLSQANFCDVEELLENAATAPLPVVLALDQVKDPGNLGAICRTAFAFGCAGLLLPRHNSASLGPAAYRSSAGALQRMPCAIAANLGHALDSAEESDFHIYGTACVSANELNTGKYANVFQHEWQFPAVLVLGGEEKGMRDSIVKRCETLITIPLARNFDSLNVAQASAIILAFFARQNY